MKTFKVGNRVAFRRNVPVNGLSTWALEDFKSEVGTVTLADDSSTVMVTFSGDKRDTWYVPKRWLKIVR